MENNYFIKLHNLRTSIATAKQKLKEKDYIGRKIAEVLLIGTPSEIEAIKLEYANDIAEAKLLRESINVWEEEKKQLMAEKLKG